jgi:hypothetical protein
LADANPLFFPAGELFSESVEIEPGESTYRALFLPKICSPLLGFRWPTDIGLDTFVKSLELLGRVYKPFLFTIEALQPLLATDPTEFVIPTCSYASIETTAFPALQDAIYPPAIMDHCGFSPLMDMRYGLAWRLNCDQVLTLTTGPGLHHFRTFLQRGADGITSDTYLQAAIPGRFCPHFGFHFKPHNEVWPTLANPIAHFKSAFLVGLEAQDYDPVILEIHSGRLSPSPALLTQDERSTQRHRASTPRHT